ncbi:60S ribosomal protein L18a, putative [Eimeria tenella]|uniref:60S ribosomal protein L18a n=1 Tax=Eimeria tenella TaxID=5802 RepID=U6KKW2_EIMTE|nr:60S ribosomal protein L18a, putative [Eimeria tenella]CDJ37446.1 60S ribosomal protein L18a, putative [Eimeria tenella]|eukprot:XP_013228284.1 60S ribosomal protein L18a, putative [Eimeria tenella]
MKADKTLQQPIRQFQVVGRQRPAAAAAAAAAATPAYRLRLFAANEVLAVSRFWYLLRQLRKIKRAHGEVLEVVEINPKRATNPKNFGVWLRYDSRTGSHNMYKEVRDISENAAAAQVLAEMAGRHRALASNIQARIIRIVQLKGSECRRPHVQQMLSSKLKMPAIRRIMPIPKAKRSTFVAKRPRLFLN